MAKVVKVVKWVRNNWKKSIFFTGLTAYGIKYAKGFYEDGLIRHAYCLEAKQYGDEPLRTGEHARKVTVFLNPAARKGKARKLFEKNAAPILHLAGLDITLVKTEYEGQAKKYMEVLDHTDAIVVAGGDGTLSEVVTGLLRREDMERFSKVPIGFVPLGNTNTLAQTLFERGASECNWMAEAAIAVVRNVYKPMDVMKIEGDEGKSVFAVNGLEWGTYKDTEIKAKKAWYFGPLKERWAFIRSTFGSWPPLISAKLNYSLPCDGCSKCYTPPPVPQWKWWHLFLAPRQEVPQKDYSEVVNEQCGVIHEKEISTLELRATTSNNTVTKPEEARGITVSIEPNNLTKLDFIKDRWSRLGSEGKSNLSQIEELTASEFMLSPDEKDIDSGDFYIIDNEQYEIKPIKVEFMKDQINLFCSKSQLQL